jgi:hypothetical protein
VIGKRFFHWTKKCFIIVSATFFLKGAFGCFVFSSNDTSTFVVDFCESVIDDASRDARTETRTRLWMWMSKNKPKLILVTVTNLCGTPPIGAKSDQIAFDLAP